MLNKHASETSMPPNKDIYKERNETACPRAGTENSTDSLVTYTTLFVEDGYLLRLQHLYKCTPSDKGTSLLLLVSTRDVFPGYFLTPNGSFQQCHPYL